MKPGPRPRFFTHPIIVETLTKVTRENNKLHAKVDPDKFGRQKMNLQAQNEEKIRVLQAEIERLAVLLKVC